MPVILENHNGNNDTGETASCLEHFTEAEQSAQTFTTKQGFISFD